MLEETDSLHPVWDTMRHPFHTQRTEQLQKKLIMWANAGITGAVILGEGRTGKSTSITLCKDHIKAAGASPLASLRYRAQKQDKPTIAECYRNLFFLTGEQYRQSLKTHYLKQQITHFIVDLAARDLRRQVLLFVDEFQRLTLDQLIVFAELQDKLLEDFKIILTVFLFGNLDESRDLLDKVETEQYDFLYGRFFTQKHIFHGISTKEELRTCIRKYDVLRHPDPDGPTYTEYFLPNAFSDGWRLEELTDLIWKTYTSMTKPARRSSWGMRYFTSTIATLLTLYLPKHGVTKANESMIQRCIESSGLPQHKIIRTES